MAISGQDNSRTFVATGTAAPVAIAFPWANASDLVVQRLADGADSIDDGPPETLNSSYSIGGIGRATPPASPTGFLTEIDLIAGRTYRIERQTALLQKYLPRMGIAGDASAQEHQLDDIVMAHQDKVKAVGLIEERALMVPRGETAAVLQKAVDRAGKFAAFNSLGDLVGVLGAVGIVAALASNIVTDGGGSVQQALNASLQSGKVFNSVVTTVPGDLAGWVLTTTPTPGHARDGLLIYHTMDDPSNGLHVLGYANVGCVGGQAGGLAMDGPGTGSAAQCNRRGAGAGNGVNGNRVDDGNGYGVSGQFSSIGTGAGVQAIKQNSGVTGTAGTGPALLIENSSFQGHAIDSATALVNATDTSHRFTRLQREGINADFRMSNAGARAGATSVVRVVLAPGAASTGTGAITAYEALVGANINGAVEVNGFASVMDGSGNTTTHAFFGLARGANGTNYGGRFGASGGGTNIPLRVDGQSWLLGNIQGSLPQYANDAAAAATLQIGYWYINSTTGAVTSRRV